MAKRKKKQDEDRVYKIIKELKGCNYTYEKIKVLKTVATFFELTFEVRS